MFAKAKAVAAIGAAATSLGWVSVAGLPAAHAQPPHLPGVISCPDTGGTQYLPDPENSNGYYVCENGAETQHNVCPAVTKLVLSTPPRCTPWSNHHMP